MRQRKHLLTRIALACAPALATSAGHAQAQPKQQEEASLPVVKVQASREDGLAKDGYLTIEASVGSFGKAALVDTPFSVKALSSELLLNQKIEDIGSLDRLAANVTSSAATPGGHSEPFVRGLPLHNFSNVRFNGLNFLNIQLVGLENKQSVEILSGLSALQAGFASPGGIVNYVTKRPARQAVNAFSFAVDSHGNAKIGADLSRRSEDGRLGLRVNAGSEALRSFVNHADGNRKFLSLAGDWQLAPRTNLYLDLEHQRRYQAFQPGLTRSADGRLPRGFKTSTYLGQKWDRIESEYTVLSGKLDHALNDNWSLTLEASRARQKRDQNTTFFDALQPDGEVDVYYWFAPAQLYTPTTLRLSAKGRVLTGPVGHDLVFGYSSMRIDTKWPDYSFDFIDTTNIYAPRDLPRPNFALGPVKLAQQLREQGLFFNDIMSFGADWRLHFGGRYVTRKQTNFGSDGAADGQPYDKSVFTPSVALVYKPRANISTYVSYIEGLENGGTAPLDASNRNQQLKPLRSRQVEAGVKAEIGNVLAELALFQIDRAGEYLNADKVYVQDGKRRHRGLEVSLTGKLNSEWTLLGSAALLDAKLEETGDPTTQDKRPSGVPKQRFVLMPEYTPSALPGWAFNANWTYTGSRELNDQNTGESAPGYNIVGLGARYRLQVGATPLTLRMNIDNLFDKFYWSGGVYGNLGVGAPRTVSASLGIEF